MALDLRSRNGWYSTGQVAILLGKSRSRIRQMVYEGKLRGYYMNDRKTTKILVKKEDLKEYLRRQRVIG